MYFHTLTIVVKAIIIIYRHERLKLGECVIMFFIYQFAFLLFEMSFSSDYNYEKGSTIKWINNFFCKNIFSIICHCIGNCKRILPILRNFFFNFKRDSNMNSHIYTLIRREKSVLWYRACPLSKPLDPIKIGNMKLSIYDPSPTACK